MSEKRLPQKWQDHLLDLPESGMGFQICDIYTSSTTYRGVLIKNSAILETDQEIDLTDIQDIKLSTGHTTQVLFNKPKNKKENK